MVNINWWASNLNKKNLPIIFFFFLAGCLFFYLFRNSKTISSGQNQFCFCSSPNDTPRTACFHPKNHRYAYWNTKFDLFFMPFKFPDITGEWRRDQNNLEISLSNNKNIIIPFDSKTDGPYPSQLIVDNSILSPKNCEYTDIKSSKKIFEKSKDYTFLCTDGKIGPKLNIEIDLKNKLFTTWEEDILLTREMIFFEPPTKNGKLKIKGNQISFNFSDGIEREGIIQEFDPSGKIPELIKFGAGNFSFSATRSKCIWLNESIETISLMKEKNVLCEKRNNDQIAVFKSDGTIDMYLNLRDYSYSDFALNKISAKGTNVNLNENKISFKIKGFSRSGTFEKNGESISKIKFPLEKPGEFLEYSKDYCPPFFLTNLFF